MSYSTSTYLIHFNKNHSSKDGKFTYGDGDGDGITDDHANQRKAKVNAWHERVNQGFENAKKHSWVTGGNAKKGDAPGYHRSKNIMDYPYYVDTKGRKHYYKSVWDLPYGDRGREYVHSIGKLLTLPVSGNIAALYVMGDIKSTMKSPEEEAKKFVETLITPQVLDETPKGGVNLDDYTTKRKPTPEVSEKWRKY